MHARQTYDMSHACACKSGRKCDVWGVVFTKGALIIPGLCDVTGFCTVEELVETVKAKFTVVGFDFATVLFSPSSSCILFAIVLVQLVTLKFREQQSKLKRLMLNRWKRLFPLITCEMSFVSMSASWFLVSMYLIWILGSKLILSNNQSRATLRFLETCLIVGASSLYDHLDHCFVVLKHIQQSFLIRRLDVSGNKINIIQIIDHSLRLLMCVNRVRCWTKLKWVRTQLCNCQQYLCLFHIVFEYIPDIHDQGKMLVLPNQLVYWVLYIGLMFCFFPANLMSSTYIDKNNPFHGVRMSIPNFKTFSQQYFNKIFWNCLSHDSPAKSMTIQIPLKRDNWVFHTGPMIWAICGVVDESKCLDIPILEFSTIVEHLPFWPGCKQMLHQLLVLGHPGRLDIMSMTFAAVIWDADDPCSVNTAYEPELSFAMYPRSTTLPLFFLKLWLQLRILEMTEVH